MQKSGPTSLYAFKQQLDAFIKFHSLSSQWRPLVYRPRNADQLTSMNAVDKFNRPLTPQKYPGTPSQAKFEKFVKLLVDPEEVRLLRSSFKDLFKLRLSNKGKKDIKYIKPSMINMFLYKSFALNYKLYSENLLFLNQVCEEDSVWSVKNTEAVAFLTSMLLKYNPQLVTYDQFNKKLQYYIKRANLDPSKSILFNASSLIASIYSGKIDNNALDNLDKLTSERVYKVREGAPYLEYDHAYSILTALKEAANVAQDEKLNNILERWNGFLNDVAQIKDIESAYEGIVANPPLLEAEQQEETSS